MRKRAKSIKQRSEKISTLPATESATKLRLSLDKHLQNELITHAKKAETIVAELQRKHGIEISAFELATLTSTYLEASLKNELNTLENHGAKIEKLHTPTSLLKRLSKFLTPDQTQPWY